MLSSVPTLKLGITEKCLIQTSLNNNFFFVGDCAILGL